jgi:hypothetical protein
LLTASAGKLTEPLMASYNRGLDRLAAFLQRRSTQQGLAEFGRDLVAVGNAISFVATQGHVMEIAVSPLVSIFRNVRDAVAETRQAYADLSGALDYVTRHDLAPLLGAWRWLSAHAHLDLVASIHVPGVGTGRQIRRNLGRVPTDAVTHALTTIIPGAGALGGAFSFSRDIMRGLTGQASGGRTLDAGWSWVGERGPELAWMPKGAVVQPLDRSAPASGGMDRLASAVESLASRPIVVKVGERVLFEAWGDELDRRMANR